MRQNCFVGENNDREVSKMLKPELWQQRTWIDINLDAVKQNYHTACSLTSSEVICVLKSNAYGHGAVRVAQALQEEGCRSFAMSCGREAILLRRAGITGHILVMGIAEPAFLEQLIHEGVSLTAASLQDLLSIEEAAERAETDALVHIKLDTGFHRLGFDCTDETVSQIAEILPKLSRVRMVGLFSHLGLINSELDHRQNAAFAAMIHAFGERGIHFEKCHLGDSIGLVRYPEWHYDAVRVGAFLFGVRPSRTAHMPFADPETMIFRTTVTQIREVAAGEVIGYGDEQIFDHPVRVATLAVGYGDGYPRRLSYGKGQVIIRGKRCPVIGLICMDQMMADVSAVPEAEVGDMVTLLGGDIPYMEYSDWAGSNRNECITAMTSRPLRLYYEQGRLTTVVDEMTGIRTDE